MGKDGGFLTPKAIGNRIKSKGLQKLRWFCQMCEKQCRDENGFKCHLTSESHQRQLLLFADNPNKYLYSYSNEFLSDFMLLLRRRFGTKRVSANVVYQEYIGAKDHLHMNATRWHTLTELVKWLGSESKCVVDQTEKGWFISYIDRNPETVRRQKSLLKKERMEMDDEERKSQFIEQQIERDKGENKETVFTDLKREQDSESKVTFNVKKNLEPSQFDVTSNCLKRASTEASGSSNDIQNKVQKSCLKKNVLQEIIEEEKLKKSHKKSPIWIRPGIVVKIKTKSLGDKYKNKKANIVDTNEFIAVVKMVEGGKRISIDQADIETVIPAVGRQVTMLQGRFKGCQSILLDIDHRNFSACLKLLEGKNNEALVLNSVEYADFSKTHNP